jgi:signal transduction histidine kinase/ActR/RegA family two-component response regulator
MEALTAMAEKPTYEELEQRVALLENESEQRKRFEEINSALFKIANAINVTSNLDELYHSIHQALSTIIDTTNFFIALYDKTNDSISFPYIVDTVDAWYPPVIAISKVASLTAEIIRNGKPLMVTKQEIMADRAKSNLKVPACTPAEIWLGVPLLAGGEIIGVMAVQSYNDPGCYDQTDLQVMTAVADQVAIAIDRKRAEETLLKSEGKLAEYANQMEQFSLSAASMISLKDEKVIFAKISRAIVDFSDYRRVIISLFKDEHPFREVIGYGGVSADLINRLRKIPLPKSWYDHVFSQGHHMGQFSYYIPHTMKHILNQEATLYGQGSPPEDSSSAWHPEDNLFVRMNDENGQFIGVISVDDSKSGHKPSLETIRPLEIYASLIAQIIILKREQTNRERLEEQLRMAQKMESVGRLAGGVAHDFNNMLGVILGHAELAQKKLDPADPVFSNLEEIHKAATRSAQITRQLLAFARKQTVVPRILDLNETVEGMLEMLRRLIGENINLSWMPENGLWPVQMDPSQIDQILANLCVNARQAIGGVGKITVLTGNSSLDEQYCDNHAGFVSGDYVRLVVTDDGCGMDRQTLAHIFEPFFTTKAIGEGTGLGLATVYGAVKQNNGFVYAESEPGQGAAFTIYLPRYQGAVGQAQTAEAMDVVLPGHESILLLEDEPAILEMTTTMLQLLGYTVLAAGTTEEALRLAVMHEGEIDLLLTDVIMPEMNGRDLAGRLLVGQPEMRVLFMSGYAANILTHQGVLDAGVNFLEKPFSMQELAAKVRQTLEGTVDEQQ